MTNTKEKIKYPEIKKELVSMFDRDQELIKQIDFDNFDESLEAKIEEVDKQNRKRLKEIINEIGWPTISKVGVVGSQAAWLIAQHADKDIKFQKKCLKLMKENINDIKKGDIAYLTDRILVHSDKPQKYGTQFYSSDDQGLQPRPIEDRDNLNKRRKKMGLESFEESKMYKKMESDPKKKKKK